MMILDGLFPEPRVVSKLEKVFGKEFMETIKESQDKFKADGS